MKYESNITLGKKYRDERTGVEGFAIITSIFQFGCERTSLEWEKDGQVNTWTFDTPRIANGTPQTHESPIILGEQYEDKYTGIRGVAAAITFHEIASENVTLEFKDKDGNMADEYFDVGRLKPVSRGAKAEATATQEKRETPVRTGGPMRGTSHIRTAPTRR